MCFGKISSIFVFVRPWTTVVLTQSSQLLNVILQPYYFGRFWFFLAEFETVHLFARCIVILAEICEAIVYMVMYGQRET